MRELELDELGLAPTRETVDRLRSTTGAAIDLFAAHDEEEALVRARWLLYLASMFLYRSGTAREAIDRLISVSDRFADTHPSRLPGMLPSTPPLLYRAERATRFMAGHLVSSVSASSVQTGRAASILLRQKGRTPRRRRSELTFDERFA